MTTTNCTNCGAPRVSGAAFCENCGEPLRELPPAKPEGIICPNCGTHAALSQSFCDFCGTALTLARQAPAASPPGVQPIICAKCGHQPILGASFCDRCGTPIQVSDVPSNAPPAGTTLDISSDPVQETTSQAMGTPVAPRLVVQPSKTALPFPANKNEIIIGREDPISSHFPDVELGAYGGDDGGVSRRHARITIHGDQLLLEDLESINFTFINKQKLEPGSPRMLHDGDELRFGRVVTIFRCT